MQCSRVSKRTLPILLSVLPSECQVNVVDLDLES